MISIAEEPVLEGRWLKPSKLDVISTLDAAISGIRVPHRVYVGIDFVDLFGTNGSGLEKVSGPKVNESYVCQALGIRYTS